MSSVELGRWGESCAVNFLRVAGYDIVDMNYRIRQGEIDIIARDDKFTVFVEVKLRKNARYAAAREYVNFRKQEKIRMAAIKWLSENENELQPRFDVIEIYAPRGENTELLEINHITNAFW